jgi:hypothetical protein
MDLWTMLPVVFLVTGVMWAIREEEKRKRLLDLTKKAGKLLPWPRNPPNL